MSDWDFLWDLEGQELLDAMASGGSYSDWAYIEEQERRQNQAKKTAVKRKKQTSSQQNNKANSRVKKKNTSLFIDGENISSKKAGAILKAAEKQGVIDTAKVYGMQKDEHTKGWTDKAKECGLKDIRLSGSPKKDKVDKKITKDTKKAILEQKNLDIVCIATSDGGYVDTVKELRAQGKRVVVIGEDKAPKELRNACSEFIEV